jgi:hypothetical protein
MKASGIAVLSADRFAISYESGYVIFFDAAENSRFIFSTDHKARLLGAPIGLAGDFSLVADENGRVYILNRHAEIQREYQLQGQLDTPPSLLKDQSVAVATASNNRSTLSIFSAQGTLSREFTVEGSLRLAPVIMPNGDLVLNVNDRELHFYSAQGKLKNSLKIEVPVGFAGHLRVNEKGILVFEFSGDLGKNWLYFIDGDARVRAKHLFNEQASSFDSFRTLPGGGVLMTHKYNSKIEYYSATGNLEKVVSLKSSSSDDGYESGVHALRKLKNGDLVAALGSGELIVLGLNGGIKARYRTSKHISVTEIHGEYADGSILVGAGDFLYQLKLASTPSAIETQEIETTCSSVAARR